MSPPVSGGVGEPIPLVKHAVSVSLPSWADTIQYKSGDACILNRMQTGYPRYFIHRSVRKLALFFEQNFAFPSEKSILLRSSRAATECCAFLASRGTQSRVLLDDCTPSDSQKVKIFVVFYRVDPQSSAVAQKFWQLTGLGISSRLADNRLALLSSEAPPTSPPHPNVAKSIAVNGQDMDECGQDMPLLSAASAKKAICSLIADLLSTSDAHQCYLSEKQDKTLRLPDCRCSARVIAGRDIFLYPTGMTAIWSAYQLCLGAIGQRKSVCFGFPYTDTLKVLQNWGPGTYFYADGRDSSIDELQVLLSSLQTLQPSEPPILALFTEFPSNPLLQSVNLPRLRKLADQYDFLIIVDDTIGNFANVQVLPFADIVVTSLTKIFSGQANVMGGSLTLNPAGKHCDRLRAHLHRTYEDLCFDEDVIIIERNSRDFVRRVAVIDSNAESVCEYLRSCSPLITEVYYPKWQTPKNYEMCRRKPTSSRCAGYGGLFSLLFASAPAAHAFFDALPCSKGPSLGTNFTLACPYAIIAHFAELDWAAQYGVPMDLVRVSIGMEERSTLLTGFTNAIMAAEEAHAKFLAHTETIRTMGESASRQTPSPPKLSKP